MHRSRVCAADFRFYPCISSRQFPTLKAGRDWCLKEDEHSYGLDLLSLNQNRVGFFMVHIAPEAVLSEAGLPSGVFTRIVTKVAP